LVCLGSVRGGVASEHASVDLDPVRSLHRRRDGVLGVLLGEVHEGDPLAPAGLAVVDDAHGIHLAEALEVIAERAFIGVEVQTADEHREGVPIAVSPPLCGPAERSTRSRPAAGAIAVGGAVASPRG
jgi:hypothetical protein